MPQGERLGDIDLIDQTYDGSISEGLLQGGLGQLTDGVEGNSNFRQEGALSYRGYDWIGWKNDTRYRQGSPIEITFSFDTVRNFTLLSLYTSNQFKKEVRLFKKALVHFSIGGLTFQTEPIRYFQQRDSSSDEARHVVIPLEYRVGRAVRVELFFDARWMLLSEVHFESGM